MAELVQIILSRVIYRCYTLIQLVYYQIDLLHVRILEIMAFLVSQRADMLLIVAKLLTTSHAEFVKRLLSFASNRNSISITIFLQF